LTIRLRDVLPYVTASLLYEGRGISMENVVLDTGSTGTVFAADKVLSLGLRYEVQDGVHPVRGVGGGVEFVFTKQVESLSVGELRADGFEIEVGAMDYGFEIDGILGMDFLIRVGAIVDLARLEMRSSTP
jgi:hypothetical protein